MYMQNNREHMEVFKLSQALLSSQRLLEATNMEGLETGRMRSTQSAGDTVWCHALVIVLKVTCMAKLAQRWEKRRIMQVLDARIS